MLTRAIVVSLALMNCTTAVAEVSLRIGVDASNVSFDLVVPMYQRLEAIPGYPVYYAPRLAANYFFYDGVYWVFEDDTWYASDWYDGPWDRVDRYDVPVFVLRIPVRYYRAPPRAFRGWRASAPPRWNDHWGHEWARRRAGWDRWDHRQVPARPPLPTYQRGYSGDRYPQGDRQRVERERHYNYVPRESAARAHYPTVRVRDDERRGERAARDGTQTGAGERSHDRVESVRPQRGQSHGRQSNGVDVRSRDEGHERGRGHEKHDKDGGGN